MTDIAGLPAQTPTARRIEPHRLLLTRWGPLLGVALATAILAGVSIVSHDAKADIVVGALRIPSWTMIGVILAATSLLPLHRRRILVLAALLWVIATPPVERWVFRAMAVERGAASVVKFWPAGIVLAWAIGFALLWVVQNRPKSPIARRPVVALILLLILLLLATRLPLRGLTWVLTVSTAMSLSSYLWFFAYWLSENATRTTSHAITRTGFWRPFWGFTNVPFGKGAAYLERVEAKNAEELAVAQWKGLKLLAWGAVFALLVALMKVGLYHVPADTALSDTGRIGINALIPPYPVAVEHVRDGVPISLPMRWASLVSWFVLYTATLTAIGAKFIGIARLAGFNAFRNTYRPFEATTIADFYNRIYYYFKELLVTFFFFPTYLRYLKKHPKLRLFIATFAAAGFGNWLFHFLRDSSLIVRHGPWFALKLYNSYAVYALVLSVAIGLSQLRLANRRGRPVTGFRRYRAIAGVLLFYILISVFQEPTQRFVLADYTTYLVRLFWP